MRDKIAAVIVENRACDNWSHPLPADLELADAILAALPGWQPIETAPERQTILVCQSQNSIMATARGKNKHGNWRTGVGPMDYIAGVTHWMPLPDAPDRAAVCKAMGLP